MISRLRDAVIADAFTGWPTAAGHMSLIHCRFCLGHGRRPHASAQRLGGTSRITSPASGAVARHHGALPPPPCRLPTPAGRALFQSPAATFASFRAHFARRGWLSVAAILALTIGAGLAISG